MASVKEAPSYFHPRFIGGMLMMLLILGAVGVVLKWWTPGQYQNGVFVVAGFIWQVLVQIGAALKNLLVALFSGGGA